MQGELDLRFECWLVSPEIFVSMRCDRCRYRIRLQFTTLVVDGVNPFLELLEKAFAGLIDSGVLEGCE
jgi:hypothetical protein